jgi:hypothetical protein
MGICKITLLCFASAIETFDVMHSCHWSCLLHDSCTTLQCWSFDRASITNPEVRLAVIVVNVAKCRKSVFTSQSGIIFGQRTGPL